MASTRREQQQTIRSTSFTLGLQYDLKISDNLNVIFGGTFENKSRLVVDNYLLVMNTFRTEIINAKGLTEISLSSDTVDYKDGREKTHLPMRYGAGVSINFKNKLLLSADYSSQKWSDFKSFNPFDELADSKSMNFGIQYTPDERAIRNYWKRIGLRAGFYTSDTYIKVKGQQLQDYGVTFGLKLPFKGYKSAFQLSYEYGKRGTLNQGLIQENYHVINLGITLHDFWFIKTKYD
jgi:long-subunit fatty acid transport protein